MVYIAYGIGSDTTEYLAFRHLSLQVVVAGSDDVELTLHGENLDVVEMNRYYEVVLQDIDTDTKIFADILYDQISNSTLPLRVSTDQYIPYGLRMNIWVSSYVAPCISQPSLKNFNRFTRLNLKLLLSLANPLNPANLDLDLD